MGILGLIIYAVGYNTVTGKKLAEPLGASEQAREQADRAAAQTVDRAADQAELAKANPDCSKIGTKLSDQCAGEIRSKRVSRYCEAEGQAWSEGLKLKLNDPRLRREMDDMASGRR